VQKFIDAAEASRKRIFKEVYLANEYVNFVVKSKTTNENLFRYAPCPGSKHYNAAMIVCHMFNAREGEIALLPTRQDMITALGRQCFTAWIKNLLCFLGMLFKDGRGGISDPTLLPTMILLMFSYLGVRANWQGPISNSGSLAGRMSFADKLKLELNMLCPEQVQQDKIVVDDDFPQFHPNVAPRTTEEDFVRVFGQRTFDELTVPLTDQELAEVFVMKQFTL
jgi:hypothetical protein